MTLILTGTSHHTSPIALREKLAFDSGHEFAEAIAALEGVHGVVLLSTCNRFEVVVSAEAPEIASEIVDAVGRRAGLSPSEIEDHLYLLHGGDVVRHLCRVTAGLDSLVKGEPQIGGQVRRAWTESKRRGRLDRTLNDLFEHTFRVSKRARRETGIGELAVSVPWAAVELARRLYGDVGRVSVAVVGGGEMGVLTARRFAGFSPERLVLLNRDVEKIRAAAIELDAEYGTLSELEAELADSDVIVVSTAAQSFIVTRGMIERAIEERAGRDLFIIDLSVPRNVEPVEERIEGVYLYDIDDLQQVVDRNLERRSERALRAEAIIEHETEEYLRMLASRDVVPTIVELRSKLEEIRAAELEKCLRKAGPMTTEQAEAIEAMTSAIINKVLHYPIVRLRESAADHEADAADRMRDAVRRIFGL